MEPSDIVDVPIGIEENEHNQLPSVEEARIHAHNASPTRAALDGRRRRKRVMLASILIGLAVLGLVIGLAVGLSGRNERNSTSAAQGSVQNPSSPGRPAPQPTARPPAPPTLQPIAFNEREEAIISFLNENELSEFEAVRTEGSPQHRAIKFLANDDALNMPIPDPESSLDDEATFQFVQRYAVSVFYYALGVKNLVSSGPTCEWFREFHNVGGHSTNIGVVCNGQQEVYHVFCPNLNLQGSLPAELGLLTSLATLVLPDNRDVHGSIPDSLRKLTDLELLDLGSNNLTGRIPSWIDRLTSLEYLALSDNSLSGIVPSSISELTSLALLALDGNELTGNVHVLDNLKSLRYLYLERNQFAEKITNTTFKKLINLVHLDLSNNKFHGVDGVPKHFFEFRNLEVLDLTDNSLRGHLPKDLPHNSDLRFFFVHNNDLSGSIPKSIQNLENLNHLDFARNKFTGEIPSTLGRLSSLVYLFLAVNNFDSGTIPDSMKELTNLRDLSLKKTQRTGSIPTWFGSFDELVLLDLDRNKLTGQIPTQFGDMKKLAFLLLNRNQLTGTLPTSALGKVDLTMLLVENNTITGNATELCQANDILEFVADCDGDKPEIFCPTNCCTKCCNDDELCNDNELLATFDPIWERSYQRRNYYDFGGNFNFAS